MRILPTGEAVKGPFFFPSKKKWERNEPSSPWLNGNFVAFDREVKTDSEIPSWLESCISGKSFEETKKHWSMIPDFDSGVGDIKGVWEYSRFNWLLSFARAYISGRKSKYLDQMNGWLESWSKSNPANCGPNWKCGQEASIRVMHLVLASFLLGHLEKSSEALYSMVEQHLDRIEPTLKYAMAQNNNHGTSEAAALFIGGLFLKSGNFATGKADNWIKQGITWLENRVSLLFMNDGSFSQYSTNYHRVALDTLSFCEFFRQLFQYQPFSKKFYGKAKKACLWLRTLTSKESGGAPNIGANDGARLFPLTDTSYRDFRPSVQLASVLFENQKAYDNCDEVLQWLELNTDLPFTKDLSSKNFEFGGYACLKNDAARTYIRYPVYQFRPGHADTLHLDFWLNGENILRDGGTYSYNSNSEDTDYFTGVRSHNTVEFDSHDQMPRISRFLFGSWPKVYKAPLFKNDCFSVSYKGARQEYHQRKVTLNAGKLLVEDEISGFHNSAVLRWRLKPEEWILTKNKVKNRTLVIKVTGTMDINRFELVSGCESLMYNQKTELPVLEVEVGNPGKLTTEVSWK